MEIIKDIAVMREKLKRLNSSSIGLIRVKSIWHEGHTSLIQAARKENYVVIVAKLLVKEEFISEEAYKLYPSHIEEEMEKASRAGADFFFIPDYERIYPSGSITRLQIKSPLASQLNGGFKPDYYETRLNSTCLFINMLQPKRVYMSDKDLQLVYLTRQMISDWHYDVELRVLPCLRDDEGMLLSSKNQLLRADEKTQAVNLYRILQKAEMAVSKGMINCRKLKWHIENEMNSLYLCHLEYVEVVETKRLTKIETIVGEAYIMLAVRVGKVRLYDYICVKSQ